MKSTNGLFITALMVLCGGCGGGDGGSRNVAAAVPPPWNQFGTNPIPTPHPLQASCAAGPAETQHDGGHIGNIWVQDAGSGTGAGQRLLIAETGEFRRIPPEAWAGQTFGTFRDFETWQGGKGYAISYDALDAWVSGLTWVETDFTPVIARAWLEDDGSLTLDAGTRMGDLGSFPWYEFSFASCDTVYERGSSLETLAGTYVDGLTTLAVDEQGAIFYQHSSCLGHGSAELIDPEFNMYRMEIKVESCSGNVVHAPGATFSGLAYLSDSGNGAVNDVLEFALNAGGAGSEGILIWSQTAKR